MDQSELIFALVAPIGTDAQQIATNLASQLGEFNYEVATIRISQLIPGLCKQFRVRHSFEDAPEEKRIKSYMKGANKLDRKYNALVDSSLSQHGTSFKNNILALAAVAEINERRDREVSGTARVLFNKAHILLTLKRPEEIKFLRQIYGAGLHIIGGFSSEENRIDYLMRKKHIAESNAIELLKIDSDDLEDGGQRTRDAFHLSDLFLDLDQERTNKSWKEELGRFLDLLFSHPFHTPSLDEQSMFFAHAASLRSAQLGRQVGASIVSKAGELIAIGCNEVPKYGGGQYWVGDDPDCRDHILGEDSNDRRKNDIIRQLNTELKLSIPDQELITKLKGSLISEITEFGRATHAEMEALLSCARKGIQTVGATLFTTTFPCHNCARHIICSGIVRLVYVEPYPKSKAAELHSDAVEFLRQHSKDGQGKVSFEAFAGIAPRKYAELFTAQPQYGNEIVRKSKEGQVIDWKRNFAVLKIPMQSISYLDREILALNRLSSIFTGLNSSKKIKSTTPVS